MHRSLRFRLTRRFATGVLVVAVALAAALPAAADDWARDGAAAAGYAELDPAIRTALAARFPDTAPPPVPAASAPPHDDGFAWDAAAIGFAVAIAGICVALGCVTLARHDGRLRNA